VAWRDCVRGFLITAFGASLGTLLVQQIHPDVLRRLLPPLLLTVAIYVLLKPKLGTEDHPAQATEGYVFLLEPLQNQEQSADHSVKQLEVRRLQERLDFEQQCFQSARFQILE